MNLQTEPDQWKRTKYQLLSQKLDKALHHGKLACGVKAVWNAATHRKGLLLVLEENMSAGDPYHTKELVDDIIEKVLKDGGDVEFVDQGTLGRFQQIALIEFYREDC